MGVPSPSDYWDAVEAFCASCRQVLAERFVSLVVVGSLSVGDIVPGWSDIDAYVVVDATTDGVRAQVSQAVEAVTSDRPWLATDRGSMFSVFIASRDELLGGGGEVSFLSLWDLKRHGVVACGEDVVRDLPDAALDRAWLDHHVEWMTRFLVRDADAPSFWKGRNAICFILSGARTAVLKAGVYAKRKDDVAQAFARLYPDRWSLVRHAMACRADWRSVRDDRIVIDELYGAAGPFLRWVRSLP